MSINMAKARKLRKELKALILRKDQVQLAIGARIHLAATEDVRVHGVPTPIYRVWDFPTWEDYLEQELGISTARANLYQEVHSFWGIKLKGKWTEPPVGITKMGLLMGVVNARNADTWLRKAATMTVNQLEMDLNPTLPREKDNTGSVTIACTKAEAADLRGLLNRYCKTLGTKSWKTGAKDALQKALRAKAKGLKL